MATTDYDLTSSRQKFVFLSLWQQSIMTSWRMTNVFLSLWKKNIMEKECCFSITIATTNYDLTCRKKVVFLSLWQQPIVTQCLGKENCVSITVATTNYENIVM